MTGPGAWRRVVPAVVGLLLVVCAALVIIGVSIERGSGAHADVGTAESTPHAESGEVLPHQEGARTEGVLGVPIESPAALVGLAVVSIGLAALVGRRPTRLVAGVVIVFTVAAGVLDVAEISRQLSADRVGLAVLAGLIALLRVATVAGAAVVWRAAHTEPRPLPHSADGSLVGVASGTGVRVYRRNMSTSELDLTDSWAPQACTLPTVERPLRAAEFDELFTTAVRRVERPSPDRVRLGLEPTAEIAARVADLTVREIGCCSFFTFALIATAGTLQLDITVAAGHVAVLDALAARAADGVRS